ncbi:MAG: hypothetical protein I8H71_06685 [Xanthomonadaceae bacterium]|nr:hypothetical protein [Xanthomonadaceae bacterium]
MAAVAIGSGRSQDALASSACLPRPCLFSSGAALQNSSAASSLVAAMDFSADSKTVARQLIGALGAQENAGMPEVLCNS